MQNGGRELSDASDRRRAAVLAAVMAGLFALVVMLTAVAAHRSTRLEDDQNKFNLPTIMQFARQLPLPDLADYPTATSPGYHLALAIVARFASGHVAVLRVAGSVFGVLLIATMTIGSLRSPLLILPLVFSTYVITSAGWLLPEDAAWWLAAMTVAVALRWKISGRFFVAAAILMTALVFTRQSAVWIAAPVAAAAWFGDGSMPRQRRLLALAAALVPPAATLLVLVRLWHGLTPPLFQAAGKAGSGTALNPALTQYGGISAGSALMTLAMIGLFGTPLLGWFWRGRGWMLPEWFGAGAGLLVGLVCRSDPAFPFRRSGLWSVAGHLPIIAGRSALMVVLATLGGGVAVAAIRTVPRRTSWAMAALLIGFVAVQTTNPFLWQRYYEPLALIWLIFLAAAAAPRSPSWTRILGIIVLITMQIAAWTYFLFFSAVE